MSEQDAARARRDLYDDIPDVSATSNFETWFAAWTQSGWFCTGRRSDGKKCCARCKHIKIEDFQPGISDRCPPHKDGVALRTKMIAAIARRTSSRHPAPDKSPADHFLRLIAEAPKIRFYQPETD